jgi:hypothetical protein
MKRTTLEAFIITMLIYAIFSYIKWNWDVSTWTESARGGYIFVAIIVNVCYQILKKIKP